MANKHGDFIWYELMTPDAGASAAFYAPLLGWEVREDPEYREIKASEGFVGGMLQLTPEMTAGGARPAWVGYVKVDDVDASVASITAAGGQCFMTRDMEGIGRFAMVTDPQGAPFYVMTPSDGGETSHAFAAERPMMGHCAWNELASSDPDGAKDFYAKQFGWSKDGEMDMGPMGKYEFLKTSGGNFALGAVMPKMPEMPVSLWTYYFRVPSIDAAVEQVKAGGGQVVNGPMEVPGDEWCINGVDPQGAFFALVGGK